MAVYGLNNDFFLKSEPSLKQVVWYLTKSMFYKWIYVWEKSYLVWTQADATMYPVYVLLVYLSIVFL